MIMLSGSVCWPRDLLKVDAPGCRIFTWGYDSSVANVTQAASQATIFGYSESLLWDICMSRTDQDEVERPLVFSFSLARLIVAVSSPHTATLWPRWPSFFFGSQTRG